MLKVSFRAAIASLCLMFPAAASAGLLGSGLQFLEDNDFEAQVSGFQDGTLDPGDLLLATIEVQRRTPVLGTVDDLVNSSTSAGPQTTYSSTTEAVTGVSLIRVDTLTYTPGSESATYTFEGASITEWANFGVTVSQDGVAAVLFADPPVAPGDPHIINSDGLPGLIGEVASAAEGTVLGEFTPVFWQAIAESDNTLIPGGDPRNILDVTDLTFKAGLNAISGPFKSHNILGDPDQWSGSPVVQLAQSQIFRDNGPVDLQLFGGLGTFSGGPGEFTLVTDTDLYINVVPEPTSFAIFGVMGLAGVGFRRRRRA